MIYSVKKIVKVKILPQNVVEKIMTRLDLNGDRSLTKDEFINGCLQDDFLKNLLAPNI